MRIHTLIASLLICTQACTAQPGHKKVAYSWLGSEGYPKNAKGELLGIKPLPPHQLKHPGNEFTFYENDDSILMKIPSFQGGDMFKKTVITTKRWKPAAQYGNKFYLIGTYTNDSLPGFFASFYVTKDRKSLMELHYTNPGNLINLMVFSTDSVGASPTGLVDPKSEISEAEEAVISIQ